MGNIKEINIKNRTYYFFNDMISIKDFELNLLKIDIYYIGYLTVKDSYYVKINNVNSLYLIISDVDGYIEEKNVSKYLVFDSANENNEVLKNIMNFRMGLKMRLRPYIVVKQVNMIKIS